MPAPGTGTRTDAGSAGGRGGGASARTARKEWEVQDGDTIASHSRRLDGGAGDAMLQVQQDAHDRETVASMPQRLAIPLCHLRLSVLRVSANAYTYCVLTSTRARTDSTHTCSSPACKSHCVIAHTGRHLLSTPAFVRTCGIPAVAPAPLGGSGWGSGKDSMTRISSPCQAMAELKSLTTT